KPAEFYPTDPCVEDFELEKDLNSHNQAKTYFLKVCDSTTGKNPRITAAWLPWKTKEVSAIDLNDDEYKKVDYFFTSELDNCRLEIGEADRPKVLHIAANVDNLYTYVDVKEMTEKMYEKLTAHMDAAAEKAFGDRPHRKYSKRSGYGSL